MDNRIKRLFELYESGEASDEERKIVEDWFAGFDNKYLDELSDEEKIAFFKPVDKAIKKISKKSGDGGLNGGWLMLAAASLLVISITIAFYRFHSKIPTGFVTYSYIIAKKGTKKQFTLPDGSYVYLNSGSVIRIPSNFNEKKRELSLSGEAYFLIAHNSAKPFTIHSGKLLITDLGTSFNVKAYPNENQISVAVESGKVRVEKSSINENPELFADAITRNQQLFYDEKSNIHTLSYTHIQNVTAWHRNQLFFDNMSLEEIAATLERWYNVTVKLNNNNEHCRRYTVSFNNEQISNVLNVLEKLSGISYQIKNNTIFINLKKCKT